MPRVAIGPIPAGLGAASRLLATRESGPKGAGRKRSKTEKEDKMRNDRHLRSHTVRRFGSERRGSVRLVAALLAPLVAFGLTLAAPPRPASAVGALFTMTNGAAWHSKPKPLVAKD